VVQSLFSSTDDWDGQLIGAEEGWPEIARILKLYLTYFRGQRSAIMKIMAPVAGTAADAWAMLTSAMGLKGVGAGQGWAVPSGAPELGGVVERVTESPFGDQAAAIAERETPLWQAWIQERFPMPAELSNSE
jgi:hypothetical protein